jgi:glycosyltransferase involved in cell wall biosynthesis
MRVLIVHQGVFVYGGAELLIVKLANHLTKNGIKNALLTTSMLPEMVKDLSGTEIILAKKPQVPRFLDFPEIFGLYKEIRYRLNDFDVINVQNYPAELSIFNCPKPVIWMCNEPYLHLLLENKLSLISSRLLISIDKFTVKRYVDSVVVADEFNAYRFNKIYGFTPNIINYGIDYDFFSKAVSKVPISDFDFSNNFVILQVGMLTPFKNQLASINAVEKLRNEIPNLKLILAGLSESEYARSLKKYVAERNLEKYVVFTGHVVKEQVRDLYHACNVLVHPIKSQGGWLSPFEALCAAKPIIVSKEMTASNIIKANKIGTVTNEYVNSILDVYKKPDTYIQMAEKGRIWVKENLSWDRYCERMVDLFSQSIKAKEIHC